MEHEVYGAVLAYAEHPGKSCVCGFGPLEGTQYVRQNSRYGEVGNSSMGQLFHPSVEVQAIGRQISIGFRRTRTRVYVCLLRANERLFSAFFKLALFTINVYLTTASSIYCSLLVHIKERR